MDPRRGIPGIVCAISVDGRRLPEYEDDEDDEERAPSMTSIYIEVESGARFEVTTRFPPIRIKPNHAIRLRLYIDGTWVAQTCFQPDDVSSGRQFNLGKVMLTREGRIYSQHFKFAELKFEEGEADKSLLGKLNELGTIRVEYDCVRYGAALADLGEPDWRRQALWQSAHGNDLEYMASIKPLLKDDRVAERALKGRAISHQARLDSVEEEHNSHYKRDDRHLISLYDGHAATFNFKYRSRAALQALGTLPRSPSPVPLEERPVDDLAPEEMRELFRRQRERDAAKPTKIKQEGKREHTQVDSSGSDGELEVVEPRKKRRGDAPGYSNEIITISDHE